MVDEIGRYENLESDFLTICQKFNIEAKSLPETNASGKQHYSQYYDRDSAELVARIYKRDLKHFGYRFERA